ncbi:hypothetical protein [Burkholderia cenocepacia]|uniref:hypothetical protein n=1 Tax=Burkholderia cenocepacia TaxID=95486 RepID=UPI002B248A5D|nr:hypothetical protein [Burkholderia cenocepacia]MEB2558785.1 hypothetical protein [Burkholderia cenocepacia]
MKTIRFTIACMFAVTVLSLAGCGKSDGDQFLGKWEKISGRGSKDVVISRNGDGNNFYMESKVPNLGATSEADSLQTERVPAVLADGQLMLEVGMPFALTIDKATGHLVMPDSEYVKAK